MRRHANQNYSSTGSRLDAWQRLASVAALLVGWVGACASSQDSSAMATRSGGAGQAASPQPGAHAGTRSTPTVRVESPSKLDTPTLIPSSSAGSASQAAAGSGDSAVCGSVGAEAKAQLLPSDIIWAIDTSGSMSASFPAIQQALVDFSDKVVAAGIDAHIILLAGAGLCVPPPLGSGMCGVGSTSPIPIAAPGPPASAPDTQPPALIHLNAIFGGNFGMGTILGNYDLYKEHLRPNARTQLVMTEDGAPPYTADAVTAHIEGRQSATGAPAWDPPLRPNHYVWNGVVCANGVGVGACNAFSSVPTSLLELIKNTGGILGDLDQAGTAGRDPFGPLLNELALAVIEGATLSCEYEIPTPPKGEQFDRDRVNVVYTSNKQGAKITFPRFDTLEQCADREGWTYDDPANPKRVLLCAKACESVQKERDGSMRVEFGCATVRGPD